MIGGDLMIRKTKLKFVSIFFAAIFFCAVFAGTVEGARVEVRDIEVDSSETELIGSTYTDKWHNRLFHIENGNSEIMATVWGSNDNENWEYWNSAIIGPYENENVVMGINHFWYVKLTAMTTSSTGTSSVDASLNYHIP